MRGPFLFCTLSLAVLSFPPAGAQAPAETPAAAAHVARATQAAGTEWTATVDFVCRINPDRANRADDPLVEPTKIFDNVSAIGRLGTVVYAVTTSAGIMLIDSGYADHWRPCCCPA